MNNEHTQPHPAMSDTNAEITPATIHNAGELVRYATDAAGLTKAFVIKATNLIGGKRYVRVEGWQAIAIAHGCVAGSRPVERMPTGFRAIGEVRRMSDGLVLSTAEGFVGDDEEIWSERPEYARRAMAQTRAISRACRSAFAHIVIMMDAGLETTPAEEVPREGFVSPRRIVKNVTPPPAQPAAPPPAPTPAPTQSQPPDTPPEPNKFDNAKVLDVTEYSGQTGTRTWTAYFIQFTDGTTRLEAGTFDRNIAELARQLAVSGEPATVTWKKGRRPGRFELISLARLDNAPSKPTDEMPY